MKSLSEKYPNWYKIKIPMNLRMKISIFVENEMPSLMKKFNKNEIDKDIQKGIKKGIGFSIDSYFIVKRTEDKCFFKIVVRNYNNILLVDLNNGIYKHISYNKNLYCIKNKSCPQCDDWINCDYYGKKPCLLSGSEDKCLCVKIKNLGYLSHKDSILEVQCYEYIDSIKNLIPLRKPYKVNEPSQINRNEYYWTLKQIKRKNIKKLRMCASDSYYVFIRISRLPKEIIKMITNFI